MARRPGFLELPGRPQQAAASWGGCTEPSSILRDRLGVPADATTRYATRYGCSPVRHRSQLSCSGVPASAKARFSESDPASPRGDQEIRRSQALQEIRDKTLVVNLPFQRLDIWTPGQKSRLIESLLLSIPIPVIFLAEDSDGTRVVVDGRFASTCSSA